MELQRYNFDFNCDLETVLTMMVTGEQAAALLGVKPVTIRVARHRNRSRNPLVGSRVDGRTVLYSVGEIVRYALQQRLRTRTRKHTERKAA